MLGNGLRVVAGAVAATEGSLVVETRGRRLTLAVCRQTGRTIVVGGRAGPAAAGGDGPPVARAGRSRRRRAGAHLHRHRRHGKRYAGPSSPWWYAARTSTAVRAGHAARHHGRRRLPHLGLDLDDDRPAPSLSRDAAEVLTRLRAGAEPVPPERLGFVGKDFRPVARLRAQDRHHDHESGARIPFIVEAWAVCRAGEKGQGRTLSACWSTARSRWRRSTPPPGRAGLPSGLRPHRPKGRAPATTRCS